MTADEPLAAEGSLDRDRPEKHGRTGVARELYKPDEVAEMFGLSKATIMALRLSEKWPFHKVGGSTMFSRSDIDEILERTARTPEPKAVRRTRRTPRTTD